VGYFYLSSHHFSGKLRKTENVCQDGWPRGWDMNPGVLNTEQMFSVNAFIRHVEIGKDAKTTASLQQFEL
jgi:hypothetical protein